jgi:hypothetical protein
VESGDGAGLWAMDGRGVTDTWGRRFANDRAVWFSSRRDESARLTLEGSFEGMLLGKV